MSTRNSCTLILVHNTAGPTYVRGTRKSDGAPVERTRDYLTAVAERLESDGAKVETHVLVMGDAAHAIDQAAIMYHADMIAVATHGRSAFGRLVPGTGSVAWRALAHSPVPVLLRHPDAPERRRVEGRRRVLLPLDGSQYAERAIPFACQVAAESNAELLITQVVPVVSRYLAMEQGTPRRPWSRCWARKKLGPISSVWPQRFRTRPGRASIPDPSAAR